MQHTPGTWAAQLEEPRALGSVLVGLGCDSLVQSCQPLSANRMGRRKKQKEKKKTNQTTKGCKPDGMQCWKLPVRITGTSGQKGEF